MTKGKRTTISLPVEKKLKLERVAIEISHKVGKTIQWTDVVHYMIENYQNMAKQDLIEELEENKKD
ncbi:hypothetical protein CJF42_24330 [Pseudoalteromonas sp. NBT06-2]|uniref:hypothetical protein n=1 Tax=Pseudoalteromonas sp. NBT06-2 TaxID=2025950 RepID=UPI000BA6AB1D|nr:hypothetical protein [Pseudoalteromonas sp. NBT06-2]PAJ71877.1 hypothetical protein CJF42_24330 [Pseudoalteromonas sp. NBT06-2]